MYWQNMEKQLEERLHTCSKCQPAAEPTTTTTTEK